MILVVIIVCGCQVINLITNVRSKVVDIPQRYNTGRHSLITHTTYIGQRTGKVMSAMAKVTRMLTIRHCFLSLI